MWKKLLLITTRLNHCQTLSLMPATLKPVMAWLDLKTDVRIAYSVLLSILKPDWNLSKMLCWLKKKELCGDRNDHWEWEFCLFCLFKVWLQHAVCQRLLHVWRVSFECECTEKNIMCSAPSTELSFSSTVTHDAMNSMGMAAVGTGSLQLY